MTASAEARALGLLSQSVAKTVIARDPQGIHVRAVVPASRRVSISKLANAVSASTVELLSEPELVSAYPQFELGAVPPFGGPSLRDVFPRLRAGLLPRRLARSARGQGLIGRLEV